MINVINKSIFLLTKYIMSVKIDTHKLEEFMHLDNFDIKGNYVRIGDLGFINNKINKKSLFEMVDEIKLQNGGYSAFVYIDSFGKYGNRIMALLFLPVNSIDDLLNNVFDIDFELLNTIGVDTGTFGIVNRDNSIDETFLNSIQLPYSDQDGIYINSGFGDGLYPVYVARKNGKDFGLFIDFYTPFIESKFNKKSPFILNTKIDKERKGTIKKQSSKKQSSNKDSKRPSPTISATTQKLGTIKIGNDKNKWIIVENKNGVKKWKLYEKRERVSPAASASILPVGTKKKGGDGKMWIVVETKNGVKRWQHA